MLQVGSHNAVKLSCFEMSYQEYVFVSEMFEMFAKEKIPFPRITQSSFFVRYFILIPYNAKMNCTRMQSSLVSFLSFSHIFAVIVFHKLISSLQNKPTYTEKTYCHHYRYRYSYITAWFRVKLTFV